MTTWVETRGTMLSGYAASSEGYDQSTNSYQTYYGPEVTYQYEINGVQYTGSRVAELASHYGSKRDVEKFLADHPVGSTVKIYYDPADAGNAILEKGPGSIGQNNYCSQVASSAESMAAAATMTYEEFTSNQFQYLLQPWKRASTYLRNYLPERFRKEENEVVFMLE